MFDDLIDPDPPRASLDTLANVSERARRLRRRRDATRVMGLGVVGGLLVGALAFVVDEDPDAQSEIAESLDSGRDATVDLGEVLTPTMSAVPSTTLVPAAPGTLPGEHTTTTSTTSTMPLPTEPIPYLAVGDSVMVGAAGALTERGMVVDAAISRQMYDLIPLFEQLRDRHLFGVAVVVHVGTNGSFSQNTLDAFLATMDDVPNVILMTVKADRSWTAENNALLRAADLEGDNKILLDWEALSAECPGECFYHDGIHLRPEGQQYYANLISDILGI